MPDTNQRPEAGILNPAYLADSFEQARLGFQPVIRSTTTTTTITMTSQATGSQPSVARPEVTIDMGAPASDANKAAWNELRGLFADKEIRRGFVKKVFFILTLQLAALCALIGVCVLHDGARNYFKSDASIIWIYSGLSLFLVAYLVLVCCESARRTVPINFILLSCITAGYGIVAAVVSCQFDTRVVLLALGATAVSCSLIALFATTTSWDITDCGYTICLLTLGHVFLALLLCIILVPMGYAGVADLLISITGALLGALYFVFDLQLIMGGRKQELSPEEYVLAAVLLYVDVVRIFLRLLMIIGRGR